MQSIHLTFYQRFVVWNMIGGQQTRNVREALLLYKVLDKIRPNDEEMRDTQYVNENGNVTWQLPSTDYGTRDIELENEGAELLAQYLETWQSGVRVTDGPWLAKLIDDFKPRAAEVPQPA
jgi:hypothetical protein